MSTRTARFFHISPLSRAATRLEEAEYYFLAGNLNEALAAAQQAWREYPDEVDVYRVLAYIHMARGEYTPAAQAAYQSVVRDGEQAASYAVLAQVYVTFNMLAQADETLTIARQRFPDDPALCVLTADLRLRQRREKEALPLIEYARTLNPDDGYAKALAGGYALQRKDYAGAVPLLADAVAAYPQRWDYQRHYGIALLHTGDAPRAFDVLRRNLRLNADDQPTREYLYWAWRLREHPNSLYRRWAFFCYAHGWMSGLLLLIGAITGLSGIIWVISYYNAIGFMFAKTGLIWAGLMILGGLTLLLVTQEGVFLRGRKGKRFEAKLLRIVEEAEAATP
jgi:tetratricopeptide (TPR) repeat protein